MITSPRTKDTRHQIENEWDFEELMEANEVYDALDDAEARARAHNQPPSPPRRGR